MMRLELPPIVFPLLLTLFAASPAAAEFLCKSSISYVVVLAPRETPAAGTNRPAATPSPVPPGSAPPGEVVQYATIEASGETEQGAQNALLKTLGRTVEQARQVCAQRHENVGGCIAGKFATQQSTLRSMDFSARKKLEDAITSDCEHLRGTCQEPKVTAPVCTEVIKVKAVETPVEEPKKDDKKKKK
jgi:hypothetical protein